MNGEDRAMPNAALRVLLQAIAEVMGENGLKSVLNLAGLQRFIDNYPPNNLEQEVRFSDYALVEQAVEDFYGPRGAKAMLLRIGRATFRYGLNEQPAILGLAGLALKLMPAHARVKLVLGRMVEATNRSVNQPTHLEEQEDCFIFVAEDCPCRFRGKKDRPVCFVTVGALQEALRWATGRDYRVEEISCIAMGDDACRYRISKEPIQ